MHHLGAQSVHWVWLVKAQPSAAVLVNCALMAIMQQLAVLSAPSAEQAIMQKQAAQAAQFAMQAITRPVAAACAAFAMQGSLLAKSAPFWLKPGA